MDGLATDLDFPAAEKTYSHVSAHALRALVEVSPHSSRNSEDESKEHATPRALLTPSISRVSVPAHSIVSRSITRLTTRGTAFTADPSFEVDFDPDDPYDDPRNYPTWYKAFIVFAVAFTTLVVVVFSTSYTSTLEPMTAEFGVTSNIIPTLGVTTYLFGLAVGSVVLAPISETYGRKPVYAIALFCFFILILPCALAKNMATVIVVRFFVAVAGSASIANAPGSLGDIVSDEHRALVFSVWSIGPMNGPVFGPIIGGFVTQYTSWRWANWLVLIWGAVACLLMCIIKETYEPVLLQQKAKKMRKETGDSRYWSRYDVRVGFFSLMRTNLSRPFIMAVREPICIFWNVYIGVVYGLLYLCFVAYPIVYTQGRGWSISNSSLAFVGIGVGNLIVIGLASPIKKMINAHKKDSDGEVPPEAMMSVVCIAAFLCPIGELWFAWTCLPDSIHPAISIAAGIPFGMGNGGVFIYASNYLVHSYGIYAASALAGNTVVRSVIGGTLPLAGTSMYNALGAHWAGTLLGGLEICLIPIPFIFYKHGHKIREKSALIRDMREIEAKQEERRKKAIQKKMKKSELNV